MCYFYTNWFLLSLKIAYILKGLGKTCQTIALLAHVYEQNPRLMSLIVVPSSTLENWSRELTNWFPAFNVHIYKGSPDERRTQRKEIQKKIKNQKSQNPLNCILTTYSYIFLNEHDKAFFKSLKLEYVVYDEAHMLKNMKSLKYECLMKIKVS